MAGASSSQEGVVDLPYISTHDGSQDPLPRSQSYLDHWSESTIARSRSEIGSGAASDSQYVYRPLATNDTIRLIHLQPGSGNDILRLEISHVEIDDAPGFEALSYVWGYGGDLWPVELMGPDTNRGKMRLKLNLFEALHEFRLPDRPRTIWADRICINQLDLEERSLQVQLMGRIFITEATSVLVWLGWDLQRSAQAHQPTRDLMLNISQFSGSSVAEKFASDLDAAKAQLLVIASIGLNAWFTRIWTYQESLGPNVDLLWNGFTISLLWMHELRSKLSSVLFSSTKYRELSYPLNRPILLHPRNKSGGTLQLGFIDAVYIASGLSATDPRDQVFALLNFLKKSQRNICTPDYTASTTDVFWSTTASCIRETKSLEILVSVRHFSGRRSDMPSWVPDYADKLTSWIREAYYFSEAHGSHPEIQLRCFFATGNSWAVAKFVEPRSMSLAARRIGEITNASSGATESSHEAAARLWSPLAISIADQGIYVPTGENSQDVLNGLCGQGGANPLGPPMSLYRSSTRGVISCMEWGPIQYRRSYELNMFTTNTRHMGLCAGDVQQHDEVFVALGSDHPLVLRPLGDGKYKFVSAGYVHGMMRGEALIEARAELYPELDRKDFAWLMDLENMQPEDMPFKLETVTLV